MLGVLPRTAPALALHGPLRREIKIFVKSVVVPVRDLEGCVTGLTSRALAPRTVRGLVDAKALSGILHTSLLPACSLGSPGRSLRTATGLMEFTRALRVTVRGLDECAVARPGVTVCCHTGLPTGREGHGTIRLFPLTICGLVRGVGGLGGVTGIVRRLLLPPGIAATLGRG